MRNIQLMIAGVAVAGMVATTSCNTAKTTAVQKDAAQAPVLTTAIDSVSYALGINFGSGLKENLKTFPGGLPANVDILAKAFEKSLKGDSLAIPMTPEAAQNYIQSYVMAAQMREAEAQKVANEKFFAENKTKEGVVTTESGLQYKVLALGTGAKPAASDQVKVHYTGKLLDGTVFDSSVQRGEPATFGVTQVIKGWQEVLQLMPVGSKYQVWIPSNLGYGEQGAGQTIKPNSALEFEVELLDIVKPENSATE